MILGPVALNALAVHWGANNTQFGMGAAIALGFFHYLFSCLDCDFLSARCRASRLTWLNIPETTGVEKAAVGVCRDVYDGYGGAVQL